MSAAVVTYASDVLMQIDLSVAVLGFVYGSAWSDEWPYFQPEGGSQNYTITLNRTAPDLA